MKLLFVHGGEKLKEDKEGNYYTNGAYSKEVWDRYDKLSNDITVAFRKENVIYDKDIARKRFEFFDKQKYKFVQIQNLSESIFSFFSIKKRKYNSKILKSEVKRNDFIISRVPANASYKVIKYARRYNKPYLVEVVGCHWDTLWYHSLKGKLLATSSYLKMRKSVKNAPYVTYVSNEFLQNRYPTIGYKIGCSDVVLEKIKENNLKERLEKVENIKNYKKLILCTVAAVNVKYKGQQYVIKAISELNKQGYELEYHLIGGGDNIYLNNIAKKYNVEDKVKFVGAVSHDKVLEFMKKADIYIQPSNSEAHGRVILEAFSTACPCIGSSTGGIPELIDKNYIFKRKNEKDLKEKIIKLCSKNEMIEQSKRNFNKVKEYEKEKLDKKREEFYRKVLENND